jgi:hypothetical protein
MICLLVLTTRKSKHLCSCLSLIVLVLKLVIRSIRSTLMNTWVPCRSNRFNSFNSWFLKDTRGRMTNIPNLPLGLRYSFFAQKYLT